MPTCEEVPTLLSPLKNITATKMEQQSSPASIMDVASTSARATASTVTPEPKPASYSLHAYVASRSPAPGPALETVRLRKAYEPHLPNVMHIHKIAT